MMVIAKHLTLMHYANVIGSGIISYRMSTVIVLRPVTIS